MNLSMRYSLIGIGALAGLSAVHWARTRPAPESEVALYLLGVAPNLLAAVAIPAVALGAYASHDANAAFLREWRGAVIATLISTIGLLIWEWMQRNSRELVFDPHDIGATLIGSLLAIGLFRWAAMRKRESGIKSPLDT